MQKLTLCIPRNKAFSTIWSGPPKSVSSDSPQLFEYIAISFILCTRDWASISEVVAPLLFLIPYKKKSIKIPKGNQCVLIVISVIFLFRNSIFFQSLPFIQRVLFWKCKSVGSFFVHTHPFQPRTSLHYIVANPILTCNKGIVGYPASTQGVVTNCCRCPSTQCTVTTK